MTAGQARKLQRAVHIIAGLLLLVYLYGPASDGLENAVRFVAVPIVVATGIAMWQAARIRRFRKGSGIRARG